MMMQLIRISIIQVLLLASAAQFALATVTRQECESKGGQVVGDIGDGAIFGPNYICENSGEPPTDVVVPLPGEPIAIEGEVCCGGTSSTMISEADCQAQNGVVIEDVLDCNGTPPIGTVMISSTGRNIGATGQPLCCPNNVTGDPGNGLPLPDPANREEVTRSDCLEEYNGEIVGDIGNGVIFDADYRCDSNGLAPIANIIQDFSTGSVAIEGEVCCGPEANVVVDPLPPGSADRNVISRDECKEQGGEVVGDIGDGSVFQKDYVCKSSKKAPIANIGQEDPLAIEGEICCAAESVSGDESGSDETSILSRPTILLFMLSLFGSIKAFI